MSNKRIRKPIEILFVEDNAGDVRLTQEAFKSSKLRNNVRIVWDGVEAMSFLRREGNYANAPRPDIILLDLNLPKKDGREVLAEIKADENLKRIPVIVLSGSQDEEDVVKAYDNYANCYIMKPAKLDELIKVEKSVRDFWLRTVELPRE